MTKVTLTIAIVTIGAAGAGVAGGAQAAALNFIDIEGEFHRVEEDQNRQENALGLDVGGMAYHATMLGLGAASLILLIRRRWLRLEPVSVRATRFAVLPIAFFCGMIVVQGVGAAIASSAIPADMRPADGEPPGLAAESILRIGMYAAGFAVIVAFVIVMHRMERDERAPEEETKRVSTLRSVAVGFGALALVWPLVHIVTWAAAMLIEWTSGERPAELAHTTLVALRKEPHAVWGWVMIAMVVLGAPVVEEFAYRGMFQRAMRSAARQRWTAIAAASAVFVLMHIGAVEAHALAALFVLSLGFGWIYEKTGNLASAITMHAGFNALNVAMAFAVG